MSLTLYVHPASITSRPVRLFVAEKKLPIEERLVDIVTGEHQLSIADYLGASIVAAGEMIRCDLAPWPNVRRWMARIKSFKSWPRISETICSYAAQLNSTTFVTL